MNLLHRAVVTSIVASTVTLVGTPATAVTTVETSANDAHVVGDLCDASTVRVTGDWYDDVYNEIVIDVYGPRGGYVDSDYFQDEDSGQVTLRVNLCGNWARAGTYDVEVEVTGYDEDYNPTGTIYDSETFEFTKAPKRNSTVTRDVRYRPNRTAFDYHVPGRLLRAGKGFKGQRVSAYARIDGRWYEIDTQRTRKRGRFSWYFKPNPLLWAYVYHGNRTTQWDSSKNFRTPRRNGRVGAGGGARMTPDVDPSQFISSSPLP